MDSLYRYLKYVLAVLIIVLLGAKYYSFTGTETTYTDQLAARLAPAKKLLPTGARKLGFYTNITPADSALKVYYATQFIMQPVILQQQAADTMLLVLDKKLPVKAMPGYSVLSSNADSSFIYSLLKKDK